MDPNETLRMLRELSEDITEHGATPDKAHALAELFAALDEWLNRGGFLPAAWQTGERAQAAVPHPPTWPHYIDERDLPVYGEAGFND